MDPGIGASDPLGLLGTISFVVSRPSGVNRPFRLPQASLVALQLYKLGLFFIDNDCHDFRV